MKAVNNITWIDGIYELTLKQGTNGFYSLSAKNSETGLTDYAVTDDTADYCKQSMYELIH